VYIISPSCNKGGLFILEKVEDDKKKKGKIRRKRIAGTVYVKNEDGTASKFKKKVMDSDGQMKVRTRVDAEGNAFYRDAKEPKMRKVRKAPKYDSKKRKVTKRKWGGLVG
jgi:hypothetical protein